MKEFKLEDILPLQDLKQKVGTLFDTIRLFTKQSEDSNVLLYLLSAYKDGLLKIGARRNAFGSLSKNGNKGSKQIAPSYNRIREHFAPVLSSFTNEAQMAIEQQLLELNSDVLSEHFAEIFDDLLIRLLRIHGRFSGQVSLPFEIGRFCASLVALPAKASIFNPFAGLASFGIHFDQGQEYYGQELNQRTWAIGALRLMAYQRLGSSRFACTDSISQWPENEAFDLVVGTPPINVPLDQSLFSSGGTVSQFFLEKGLHSLNSKGKLLALVSQGFLASNRAEEKSFRERIVNEDLVDTVISLPAGLLAYTSISVSVLLLNKKKERPGKVRFILGNEFVRSRGPKEKILDDYSLNGIIKGKEDRPSVVRIVSSKEVQSSDYSLVPARYFLPDIKGVELREILTPIKGKRYEPGSAEKIVRIRDLKNDPLDFVLDTHGLPEEESPKGRLKLIDETCLLIAGRWKALKPTFFRFEGTPIVISQDILAFSLDESKSLVDYLILQLHTTFVQQQVETRMSGSIAPLIRQDDFLSVQIKLRSLKEQSEELTEKASQLKLVKAERSERDSRIQKLEAEIYDQTAFLRHSLAGPSSNLKDTFRNLRGILIEKVLPGFPDLLSLKLTDKHVSNLGRYLEVMERDISRIDATVSKQLNVDAGIEKHPKRPVEIFTFLRQFVQEYNERNLNFKMEFDYDHEAFHDENGRLLSTNILADKGLLREMFENLIENAENHAFFGSNQNRIEIYVMKNDGIAPGITILFSNTGKPFPEDFTVADFKRKGTRKGENGGSGFGGWYIAQIIEHFGGSFDIINETGPERIPDSDLATSFEINFPVIETEQDENV